MPENSTAAVEAEETRPTEINQNVVAQMLQLTTGRQYTPTSDQVDKIIALHEKGMDYTHKDNHTFLPKDILRYGAFAFVLLIVVGIFIFSAFYAKEYLGEIVSAILGLMAGGVSGYGLGSTKKNKTDDE